jgi:hypothetical protein
MKPSNRDEEWRIDMKRQKMVRLVVGTGVEDSEPVGAAETFPAPMEKVYCFLEATASVKIQRFRLSGIMVIKRC